ncbi:MAG TPA: hypothetical protein VFR66_16020 [Burkholderiales bacterium]|nr:hypothetical protein [Burkholderiales bacterium]
MTIDRRRGPLDHQAGRRSRLLVLRVCTLVVLASACASLAPPRAALDSRVAAVLERRGLGPDALLVIDNLLRHGPPPPPATPPLVLELLGRPLDALDASGIFNAAVPAALASMERKRVPAEGLSEHALKSYLTELAEAQRTLRSALRPFDDEALLRALEARLPLSAELLPLADSIDLAQVQRANQLFIEATVRFAFRLREVPLEPGTFESPIGTVVIGTRGDDRHGAGAALIIDPGGNDTYERAPARNGSVSVIIDLAGNDHYVGSDVALRALSAIVDLAGDDRYAMQGSGLGAALAGASLLLDFEGNDSYAAKFFAQGAAALGVGALVDFAGRDSYRIEAWGQGLGIASGTGLLWDRGGDDRYIAGGVPDPFGRGAGLSGAQGAGIGLRGRLGGGAGILRDDQGADSYQAQMFAQGSGYYYGIGMIWDRDGDDSYAAHRYAQGNAAHQAVGALRDEAGDDRYSADWYAQGMGLDVAAGVLFDVSGADVYTARGGSQGAATANGFGLLAGGAGHFELAESEHGWGRAEWLRGLPSVALLLHASGARFIRAREAVAAPTDIPPIAVQAPSAETCPSSDPGEALLCRVRDAPDLEATWRELKTLLADDALAGWIAIALGKHPPPPAQAQEIAAELAARESCNVRALALRAWPTLPAAEAGIRSRCYRLQAAARAAFARLGAPPPPDAALPSFLRSLPPQEDTF